MLKTIFIIPNSRKTKIVFADYWKIWLPQIASTKRNIVYDNIIHIAHKFE